MPAAFPSHIERISERRSPARVLAGLQAGTAGALAMLAWLALSMLWMKHSVWWFPNLMATTFGGDPALRFGIGKYTAAGVALHMLQYSFLGAVFGYMVPVRMRGVPLMLAGVLASMAWYYLMYGFVWRQINPLIPLYSPDRQLVIGHIFFGLMLGRIPNYERASVPETE